MCGKDSIPFIICNLYNKTRHSYVYNMFPLAGQTAGQYVLKFFCGHSWIIAWGWYRLTNLDSFLNFSFQNYFFFSKLFFLNGHRRGLQLVFIIKRDIRIYVSKRLDRVSWIFLWTLIFLFIISSISPPGIAGLIRWYLYISCTNYLRIYATEAMKESGEERAAISSSFLLRLGMIKYLCEMDNAAL